MILIEIANENLGVKLLVCVVKSGLELTIHGVTLSLIMEEQDKFAEIETHLM